MNRENREEINKKIFQVIGILDSLSKYDRLDIFSRYCSNCGSSDPSCQCSNDE